MENNKATLRELFEIVKPNQKLTIRAFLGSTEETRDVVTENTPAFKVAYSDVVEYLDYTLVTVEAREDLLEVEIDCL